MKTLHSAVSSKGGYNFSASEVIKHGDFKFKLGYENRNGRGGVSIQIYKADGSLEYVASDRDLGLPMEVSYVASDVEKTRESKKMFAASKMYLKKVY